MSIRTAILVYSVLFTGGLAVLVATFLSWRLGSLTADLHQRDLKESVTTAESFIEQELKYRQRALDDYSTFPAVTQGVLNPAEHQSSIVSFLSVLSARDGEHGSYTLLDFSGKLIYSTNVGWEPANGLAARVEPILADQGLNHVHLRESGQSSMVELFVPVCPGRRLAGESAEGVLIYEFPLDQVLTDLTALRGEDIALRLYSLSGTRIWESGDWREGAADRIDRYEDLDMEIQVQFDNSASDAIRRRAFKDTLRLLFLPGLFVVGLAFWLAQRYLGRPLRRLEQATNALATGTPDDNEVPSAGLVELQRLNEAFMEMRTQIRERDKRLLRSNSELERFAYVAAHDLREPLRTISNMLGLLDEESGTNLSSEYHEYLEMARSRADRMQGMLADLLAMSRLHVDLARIKLDLTDPIQQAVKSLRTQIEACSARIEFGDLPEIEGCPNLLALLFQNLFANALKFIPDERPPHIEISAVTNAGRVTVRVTDNGIGFKPQYAEQIFEVFARLHGKSSYSGSGIGLSIVRRIMDIHGGSIRAESREGDGATFILEFPKART